MSKISRSLWRSAVDAAKLCNAQETLDGKTILITGPYAGIGKQTVHALLQFNVKQIILGGRNAKLQQEFVQSLGDDDRVDGSHLLDLGDLASVQTFADYVLSKYPTIDILICNAGIMNTPYGTTKQGHEQQFGVNVLGHYVLCKKLIHITHRQVWVSSYAHTLYGGRRMDLDKLKNNDNETKYHGWIAYQQSKLGNILLAKEFAKRHNITAVSLHPGTIYTNLYQDTSLLSGLKMAISKVPAFLKGDAMEVIPKNTSAGASTTIVCCCQEDLDNGGYYSNNVRGYENKSAQNAQDASDLYDFCDTLAQDYL